MNYHSRGYTPVWKFTELRGTAAKALWTPTTSARIALTGLTVASAGPVGTIQFRFGNVGGAVIAELNFGNTVEVHNIYFSGIESTTYDRALFVEAAASTTDGFRITAEGFEMN